MMGAGLADVLRVLSGVRAWFAAGSVIPDHAFRLLLAQRRDQVGVGQAALAALSIFAQ